MEIILIISLVTNLLLLSVYFDTNKQVAYFKNKAKFYKDLFYAEPGESIELS